MRIKLDKRCIVCGSRLEFVEEEDGVYVLCRRCRMAVYVPAVSAAEYAADFPTLVELMAGELADMARRRIKQKRRN
jgi:uncharacterized protein (DUF983 family)